MTWCHWLYRSQGLSFDLPHLSLSIGVILVLCLLSVRPLADLGPYPTTCVFSCTGSSCKLIFTHTAHALFILYIAPDLSNQFVWHAPVPHVALSIRGPPPQMWWCFDQRPACDLGHLWLCSRPTTSKAFSYPSGLTDGNRWILVSSTRWRIRWLPDRYSRHMNCISRRSSSRPSTSLPWEPAV